MSNRGSVRKRVVWSLRSSGDREYDGLAARTLGPIPAPPDSG
jgi:hypothetical protein